MSENNELSNTELVEEKLENYMNLDTSDWGEDYSNADSICENINNVLEGKLSREELLTEKNMKDNDEVSKEIQSVSNKLSGWIKKSKDPNTKLMLSGLFSVLLGAYHMGDEQVKSSSISMVKKLMQLAAKS